MQLLAVFCAAVAGVQSVHAATITVTTTADSGAGSLRAALAAASDGDTIQFNDALIGQTITLTSGELVIDKNITIIGPGEPLLMVWTGLIPLSFRIFHVMPGRSVLIEGLRIYGGHPDTSGGGILNEQADLTLNSCTVEHNFSGSSGGGISNQGASAMLTIVNSNVTTNSASRTGGGSAGGIGNSGTMVIRNSNVGGNTVNDFPALHTGSAGGIYNSGMMEISDSTISGNSAALAGGGIINSGTLTITASIVRGNSLIRPGFGGGIDNLGQLTITNSTISGNSAIFQASSFGGGIYNGGPLTITNSTFSDNVSDNGHGGGIYHSQSTLDVGNTIFKAGSTGANLNVNGSGAVTVTSHGYNLISDDGGGFFTATGDQINTDPMLGPFQDNGGLTYTHALLTGSPAIDTGDPNFTPPPLYDQRGPGYDRVFNGRIDIGSFERQPEPTPTPIPCASPAMGPSEDFDGIMPPGLPTGWSATNAAGPAPLWVTSNAGEPPPSADTAPNSAFIDDPDVISDKRLDSPIFAMFGYAAQLTFRHNFNFHSGFDGGVLEISVQDGAFQDIISAGGSFISGGYNTTIFTGSGNPLGGRRAWSGDSNGFITTTLRLPSNTDFNFFRLRWRMGSNATGSGQGWRVDTISFEYCSKPPLPTPTPPPVTPTPTPTPTIGPSPTATPTPSPSATPTPTIGPAAPAQALNISTRVRVETGASVAIGGFVITGSEPKRVALRGLGPSLVNSGLSDLLADPTLELRGSDGALLLQNDNWQDDAFGGKQIAGLGLAPQNPNESAMVATLEPGVYTAIVAGKNQTSGLALVEVYDADTATDSQLANISTRGFVRAGDNVMIGGFILGHGSGSVDVALRGLGPSLGQSGLTDVLADPTLELHDGNGTLLVANDNWQDDPVSAAQLIGHGLQPSNALESGIFTTLPPGLFTAILAGKNGDVGLGLMEVYCVP